MKTGWMVGLIVAAELDAAVEGCVPKVMVRLENTTWADSIAMAVAEGVSSRIFAKVGVKLEWGAPHTLPPCAELVQMVFDRTAPDRFAGEALAYALGTTVHIFTNRILRYPRSLFPALLGHVMAHEITHVLEGVARHSAEGLMKACWNAADYDEMVRHLLPFAADDLNLLQAHLTRKFGSNVLIATL